MNTGQTMLTVAALALLSVITMRYYSSIGQTGRTLSHTNAGFTATTVATSFLERTENCLFDAISDTVTIPFSDSSRFTPPGTGPGHLGKEGTESDEHYEDFDDIDDFNGVTITYNPGWMNEEYTVYFNVYYVSPWNGNIDSVSSTQTFLKRIDITVWRSYPPNDTTESKLDIVKLSALHGYFFFNP
jgi:hypothetical protein